MERCSCRCFKSDKSQPKEIIKQVFIGNGLELTEQQFNAKLFAARKIAEHTILNSKTSESHMFYFSSLSTTTIIYKGLLMPEDISRYYTDLTDDDLVTRLALVHQRFSTNTFLHGNSLNRSDTCVTWRNQYPSW
jgi:glutamate synthase (ferredoxin)